MDGTFGSDLKLASIDLQPVLQRILDIQTEDGAIAWFENGPWDPWNHVESAMALTTLGERGAAIKAFDYLVHCQRPDGAWFGEYGNTLPMVDRVFLSREPAPAFLDANFCAYPALGIAHYLAVTGDEPRVRAWWPMVERALNFVLSLQAETGAISWSFEALGTDEDDALLAGNASILKSLEGGLYLAARLGLARPDWDRARAKLLTALQTRPDLFDRRGTGARFAMDWYYPVLAGLLPEPAARARLAERWQAFVGAEGACKCVADEPWITVAETAELVIALVAAGQTERAMDLFANLSAYRDARGVFWMGWQTDEQIFWPQERPSWTQAAVILAADALYQNTPGSRILTQKLI